MLFFFTNGHMLRLSYTQRSYIKSTILNSTDKNTEIVKLVVIT